MSSPFVPGVRNYKISRCEYYHDTILKMIAEDASLSAIGRAIGTTTCAIQAHLRRRGIEHRFVNCNAGPKNHQWKGGSTINRDGYREIYCPNHPNRRKHTPYILEHRLVMEKMIGRYLLPNEVVHHKDGNKLNNAPENLQLFSENREHLRHELRGRCPNWSPEGRARLKKGPGAAAVSAMREGYRRYVDRRRAGIPAASKHDDRESL